MFTDDKLLSMNIVWYGMTCLENNTLCYCTESAVHLRLNPCHCLDSIRTWIWMHSVHGRIKVKVNAGSRSRSRSRSEFEYSQGSGQVWNCIRNEPAAPGAQHRLSQISQIFLSGGGWPMKKLGDGGRLQVRSRMTAEETILAGDTVLLTWQQRRTERQTSPRAAETCSYPSQAEASPSCISPQSPTPASTVHSMVVVLGTCTGNWAVLKYSFQVLVLVKSPHGGERGVGGDKGWKMPEFCGRMAPIMETTITKSQQQQLQVRSRPEISSGPLTGLTCCMENVTYSCYKPIVSKHWHIK